MRRRDFLAGSAAGAAGLLAVRTAVSQEAGNTAKQAFSFGYPLVLMDLTHRAMAGAGAPDQPAPFNQFFHFPQLPTSQFTAFVCPVPDALHSSGWLNVKQEAMVVSTPALNGRFCTGSFFHAWHDVVGRIGSSVNKGKATDFLVTGPGWTETVPKGLVHIASPTNTVWAPVWISVADPADLPAAVSLQSQFRVTPLKDWRGPQPASPGTGLAGLIGSFFKKPGAPAGVNGAAAAAEMPAPPEGQPALVGPPKVDADGNPIPPPPAVDGTAPPPAVEGSPEGTPAEYAGATGTGISPNSQLFMMEPATFYTRFCQLMTDNPPLEADAAIVAKIAKLGLTPGVTVDLAAQSRANQMALLGGVRNAGQKIFGAKGGLKVVTGNRWETALSVADFGTNYDRRAYATLMYFGASSSEDVVCPRTSKDATGKLLQSQSRYTLTFAGDQLPPVLQSWTLTAYRAPFMELSENAIDRYAINSHSPVVKNSDGGVTIYVQKDNPGGEKEANWLPVPEGAFEVMLRLCGPRPDVAALAWKPPAVTKV